MPKYINNIKALQPMATQVGEKYPFYHNDESHLLNIFDYWITDKYDIYCYICCLICNIQSAKNFSLDEKYPFVKYSLGEFPTINLAAQFYGKPINSMLEDLSQIINKTGIKTVLGKKYAIHYSTLISIIELHLMLIFSKMFFYLKIAPILNNTRIKTIDDVTNTIIKIIYSNDKCEWSSVNKYLTSEIRNRLKEGYRKKSTEKSFSTYMEERIQIIYNMFYRSISYVKTLSDQDIITKLNSLPEHYFLFTENDSDISGESIRNNNYFLYALSYIKPKTNMLVIPPIIKTSNISLIIEI